MPLTHQVSALPTDRDLEYYFVGAEHAALFRPYHRPGKPFSNLKLVNFERPAISLSFYVKHKYKIQRDVQPDQASDILKEYRDELYRRSFLEQLSIGQQQELQRVDALLRTIHRRPDQYAFCISNYHHYYRYWYCSFRYFEDDTELQTSTANEHLLKHTQRADERISERINIIFIDTKYITRPVPYDSKLIDRELDTYPNRFIFGQAALYVKPL